METIIRVVKDYAADPFARIDKIPINDPNISYKAKGILIYILSKPDGWQMNIKDLDNHASDGEKAIRSGLAELENTKYVRRYKVIDSKTKRIRKWLYQFHERPYVGEIAEIQIIEIDPDSHNGKVVLDPDSRFPHLEKPHLENGTPINKVVKQLNKLITKENSNNNGRGGNAEDNIIVIPEKDKMPWVDIKTRLQNIGWAGSLAEVKIYFVKKGPEYVIAHLEKAEAAAAGGLDNPAGLFRRNIRSGERPKTEREKKYDALAALGLSEDEIEDQLRLN